MISFELSDEQRMLQETAHKFAEQEIRPKAEHYDREVEFPRDLLQKAFDVGLMNETIPEFCGGGGLSTLDSCVINEELSWGCVGFNTSRSANSLAVTPILLAATEEEKLIPGREMSRITLRDILDVVRVEGETGSHRDPRWSSVVLGIGDSIDEAVRAVVADKTLPELLDEAEAS